MRGRTPWAIWGGVTVLAVTLTSCEDDDGLARPPARVVQVVSGDGQAGVVGLELPGPLVVRVTDPRGRGLHGVPVQWSLSSGEGAFEGGFEVEGCPPVPTGTSYTDEEGLAHTSYLPTRFAPSTVTADVWGNQGPPATFTTDASDPGAVLTIAAGNHQMGKAGEALDEYLWVRVTDGRGDPVGHVEVAFAVTSGGGKMGGCRSAFPDKNPAWGVSRTLPAGLMIDDYGRGHAPIVFLPTEQGATTVSAAVSGVQVSPVTFTVTAHGAVIWLHYDWWGPGDPEFFAPDGSPHARVPVGAPVEWAHWETARFTSTSVPDGGDSFDSGELSNGERFQFVPEVAGTWEFVDQVSGATGSLTAY